MSASNGPTPLVARSRGPLDGLTLERLQLTWRQSFFLFGDTAFYSFAVVAGCAGPATPSLSGVAASEPSWAPWAARTAVSGPPGLWVGPGLLRASWAARTARAGWPARFGQGGADEGRSRQRAKEVRSRARTAVTPHRRGVRLHYRRLG